MIKAIETLYKGYRFRSRLEARWAVFFEALGVRWRYELEGLKFGESVCYLPDFYLPDWDIYLEIKPDLPNECLFQDNSGVAIKLGAEWTSIGKFFIASSNLMKIREEGDPPKPVRKQGIYMLCGTPWMPSVEMRCGRWVLKDGAVALGCIGADEGPPIFPMYAFCENECGLDLNTFYLNGPESSPEVRAQPLESPIWPNDMMHGLYVGKGRYYYSPILKKAYKSARSARFEHGETPQ